MFDCKNCGMCFRDNYCLSRHMSRKIPCVNISQNNEKNNSQKDTLNSQKDTLNSQKDTLNSQKDTLNSQKDTLSTCMFCLKQFSNNYNLKRHHLICKDRKDPVRLLEIENKIDPGIPPNKTECRFCNKDFCRTSVLNKHIFHCKDRKDYLNYLNNYQKQTNNITNNFNNVTNNNITNNVTNNVNVIINVLGNEDTTHIDILKIIQKLRDVDKNYGKNQYYLKAGEMVISYDNILREIPENQNIFIPNLRSTHIEVKTDSGWEKKEIEQVLDTTFKTSAKRLYNTKESIEAVNNNVFKHEKNKNIFNEVKQFAECGFKHTHSQSYGAGDQRKIKKSYKIAKTKD
jgi:hypothetical protein